MFYKGILTYLWGAFHWIYWEFMISCDFAWNVAPMPHANGVYIYAIYIGFTGGEPRNPEFTKFRNFHDSGVLELPWAECYKYSMFYKGILTYFEVFLFELIGF